MVALFLRDVLAISQVLLNIDELIMISLLVFLFICVLIGMRAEVITNISTAFILIVVMMMSGGIFWTVASMRNSFHGISILILMYHECSGGTPIFIMEAVMIMTGPSFVCVFNFSVVTAVIKITADPANWMIRYFMLFSAVGFFFLVIHLINDNLFISNIAHNMGQEVVDRHRVVDRMTDENMMGFLWIFFYFFNCKLGGGLFQFFLKSL
jgi:hypothetical protein